MKMKTNMQTRVRGGNMRPNIQQGIFELKKKVILALNKLADRDTYQIGVEELEKTVEHLDPDKISSFLSCILDIDTEQKSTVRKESIRLIGTVAKFHEGLVGPYLAKMVLSIVKRLKDPDSVVRDSCVETMGVLAMKMSNYEDQKYGVFISLVKPLFEAIGEQNKYLQSGSALCLARVIDNTPDPPVAVLQRMLTKTVKLLNNPHFMAKPALIELNRSIIQAGGASTKNVLFSAMTSFQEALKNGDWTTRKAAAVALTAIASTGGSLLGSLKASCIRSLESCRFDKVKPVRDSIILALQYWKGVSASSSSEPEPYQSGSSIKESCRGARENELVSTGESKLRDVKPKQYSMDSATNMIPCSARTVPTSYYKDPPKSRKDHWVDEIAVSRSSVVSKDDLHNEESDGSCFVKMFSGKKTDSMNTPETTYECIPMGNKPESFVANNANEDEDISSITLSSNSFPLNGKTKPAVRNQQFVAEEMDTEEQPLSTKLMDRRSLDSTVTVSSSQINHDCCAQVQNEMASIRKQLADIESKQSNLIDHLQVFSTGAMNSLSALQSKVLSLEYAVEGIAQSFATRRSCSDLSNSNYVKRNQGILSPRLSSCTPRPSTNSHHAQSALSSTKYSGTLENKAHGRSRLNNPANQVVNMRGNPVGKSNRTAKEDIWNSIGKGTQSVLQTRKSLGSSDSSQSTRQHLAEGMTGSRKLLKGGLYEDDELESEYVEVLSSGDELMLVELLDRTGPVLDTLSSDTINDLLSVLVMYLLEQRFMNSILPWLYQVLDLSVARGPNFLVPSAKTRAGLLSAVQEAAGMDFPNLTEKRLITQLAMKLRKLWGNCY